MPIKENELYSFDELCSILRKDIKAVANQVKAVADSHKKAEPGTFKGDQGEIIANLVLAYRHLEDSSMRVGKAIQAFDGGISVYDKE